MSRLGGRDLALPAPELAPRLLGTRLRCRGVVARIAEVEAYHGRDDLACHAAKGRTPRSDVIFREPGTIYCYLCYGIHILLNLVSGEVDQPSAVLIRGVVIESGEAVARERRGITGGRLETLCNGPGKVAQALGLTLADNAGHLDRRGCALRLATGPAPAATACGPRVGVAYAGPEWAAVPWRWWEQGFPAVKA